MLQISILRSLAFIRESEDLICNINSDVQESPAGKKKKEIVHEQVSEE
jgi:hypothetical protein